MVNQFKYIALFVALALCSCVSEFNAKLPESIEDVIIVEGSIVENTAAEFRFSKSFSLEEDAPPAGYNEVEVELYIIGSDNYRSEVAAYMGNGIHKIAVGELDINVTYGIEFKYEGVVYRSTLSKPLSSPEIEDISYLQSDYNGPISFYISTKGRNEEERYYLWNYDEDWEFTPYYRQTIFYDPDKKELYEDRSAPNYYCWRNRSGSYQVLIGATESLSENRIVNKLLFERPSSDERFSVMYSINMKQQVISKSAFEYYETKAKLSEEMGGLFTPQPSELIGNIYSVSNDSKKVIGYINVSKNISEKRLFIDRLNITREPEIPTCPTMSGSNPAAEMHAAGFLPIGQFDFMAQRIVVEFWTSPGCADCRATGGSKVKPIFWPNEHQ